MTPKPHPPPRRIRRSGKRRGFTVVELLVVISIIALLVSLLLPSLKNARGYSRLVTCQSNLKQFAIAGMVYTSENNGLLPDNVCLYKIPGYTFHPYTQNVLMYLGMDKPQAGNPYNGLTTPACPDVKEPTNVSYGFNNQLSNASSPLRLDHIARPDRQAFFADSEAGKTPLLGARWDRARQLGDWKVADRHFSKVCANSDDLTGRTANVAMLDGHVMFMDDKLLTNTVWTQTYWKYFALQSN